jgi:molybdenum cofactor guanylyltransferase
MEQACTGVILAGGLNRRFSGKNKSLLHLGKERVLDHIHKVFRDFFDKIILVTNDPLLYVDRDLTIVNDIYPQRSSLTGIHAGLYFSSTPYAFVSACDTPFLKKEMIRMILDNIRPGIEVVIPETDAGMERLCAVYSRKCIRPIEHQLDRNEFKIDRFFNKVKVLKLKEPLLRKVDPDLVSFFNMNTPADLELARTMSEVQ